MPAQPSKPSAKANFVQKLVSMKGRAETGLQSVGKNITKNIQQGDADFQSGKAPYYATVNPLKGAKAAFMSGYGK